MIALAVLAVALAAVCEGGVAFWLAAGWRRG